MKKRLISIALASAFLVGLAGCGDSSKSSEIPAGMSEGYYSAGVKVVSVMDAVIDGETDSETAAERIETYGEAMKKELESDAGQKALEKSSLDKETQELIYKQTALNICMTAQNMKYDIDLTELIDDRNQIAEDFGIDDRSY